MPMTGVCVWGGGGAQRRGEGETQAFDHSRNDSGWRRGNGARNDAMYANDATRCHHSHRTVPQVAMRGSA